MDTTLTERERPGREPGGQAPRERRGLADPSQLIAVVGLAGRFPDAPDVNALWDLMIGRGDAIGPVPADRWDASAQLDPTLSVQAVGGFLTGVDEFDATFFGISPREAEAMDPQQRLMLEVGWQALEDAGVPAASLRGSRTGTYVGASWHDYEILRRERGAGPTPHSAVGNALDVVAARLSYFLGLRGPSLTVETGCSSSLVALHLAGQALRAGEIEGALVGGVNLILTPDVSVGLTHFGGLSPTGRCQAFAAGADGFVRGEAVACLYVKTLERALADGDRVRGVIARTAVNNDGGGESLVTPSPAGQEDVLRSAYDGAGIPPDRLAYVEAHGTGTGRGDPVEAGTIGAVLGRAPGRRRPLAIGSVKTNIGHTEAAAGLAGLVKVLLALEHRMVPPSLHAGELNPAIPFDELNLLLTREPLPLPSAADGPVYLGVNSFGWGGTNAHAVVTDPPATDPPAGAPASTPAAGAAAPLVLPVSAHQDDALRRRATDVADLLDAGRAGLRAIAGTLGRERDHLPARLAVVAADARTAADRLRAHADDQEGELTGVWAGRALPRGRTAFVFPGQGSQWAGMGRDLCVASPSFAATIRRCADALAPHVDWDLAEVVQGQAGEAWLGRLDMVQPTLWAVTVGLAELWREAGVQPDVVIGHSQGEITAATVAGALSYDDAAMIMARRASIVRRVAGQGRMLAVDLDLAAARAALDGFEDDVALAVNNGPSSCVLSGETEAVLTLKELLEADGVFCRLVNVDYASHCPQMDELRPDLLAATGGARPRAGAVPMMSSVRRAVVDGTELDAAYWADNLRQPVLFADALGALLDDGVTHVVEISPHPVLSPAIEQIVAARPRPARVLTTLRRDAGTPEDLAAAFARGYVAGLEPFAGLPRAGVALPSYPWRRTRYWPAPGRSRARERAAWSVELLPATGESDAWQGGTELSLDDEAWLRDHTVGEAVVLPAAAMIGLMLATGRARLGAVPGALTDVVFGRDLTFTDEASRGVTSTGMISTGMISTGVTSTGMISTGMISTGMISSGVISTGGTVRVGLTWADDVTAGGSVALLSLPDGEPGPGGGGTGWTTHATARALGPAPARIEAAFPAALADRLAGADPAAPGTLDAAAFYAACAARGLAYGPAFQGLRRVVADGEEALGALELPARCRAGAGQHVVHPALLDAALQVSLALCRPDVTVVPTAVAAIHLAGPPGGPLEPRWSHARRRVDGRFDLTLFDADRQAVLSLTGLELRQLAAAGQAGDDPARRHRLVFRRADAGAGEPVGASETGRWAVRALPGDGTPAPAGDGPSTAAALAAALRAAGCDARAEGGADPALDLAAGSAAGAPASPLAGVVALVPPGGGRAAVPALAELARSVLALPRVPRVVIVTVGAQAAEPADIPAPEAALAWGFGRVLRREHPETGACLIDVAPGVPGWARACAERILADDGEDQVVLRGETTYVGRLVSGAAATEPDGGPDGGSGPGEAAGAGGSGGPAGRPAWRTPAQPFRLAADRPGFFDGMAFRPRSRPAPGPGEVEIEVSAAALNFIDVMKAMGTYPDPVGADALGGECAGRIVALGPGVAGGASAGRPGGTGAALAVGDRVVACVFGAMASHAVVRADHVRPIPPGLSDTDAAALPLVATTAWYGLRDLARLEAGETVLVHSATGGLGLAAIAVAGLAGARVIATAGTSAKRAYLRELGIADVFDSRSLDWADQVRAASGGRGVDVVLNSLTGAAIGLGLDVLAEDGRFVEVGKKDIYGGRRIGLDAFRKSISLHSVDLAGLMERRPERFARLFSTVWEQVEAGRLAPPPVISYPFAQAGEALRAMSRGTHIGKFVLSDPATVGAVTPEPLRAGRARADATYLISGGLGALGLSLAEFLAERGAGALALLGRSAPGPAAAARIDALRAAGTRVETWRVDVADADAMAAVLAEVRVGLPPLRGVVHAAGLLADATIANLDAAGFERVVAPKLDGARVLDALTTTDPLDLFVLFSSAAALVGNAGQAAYAAANAAMDALAEDRRRRGLPGLSVQWGPVTDVGLAAADDGRGARLAERGMTGFGVGEAWAALESLLADPGIPPVVGYVPINLRQWFDSYPDTVAQKSWELMRRAALAGDGHAAGGSEFLEALRAAPDGERLERIEDRVRELAGRVLRLERSAVEPTAPFKALGLDSLMGLELRNRLEAAFGLRLSPTLLWTYGNARALAAVLRERVVAAGGGPDPAGASGRDEADDASGASGASGADGTAGQRAGAASRPLAAQA